MAKRERGGDREREREDNCLEALILVTLQGKLIGALFLQRRRGKNTVAKFGVFLIGRRVGEGFAIFGKRVPFS